MGLKCVSGDSEECRSWSNIRVMAKESMMKQYCPVTQYVLWTTALSFVNLIYWIIITSIQQIRDYWDISPIPSFLRAVCPVAPGAQKQPRPEANLLLWSLELSGTSKSTSIKATESFSPFLRMLVRDGRSSPLVLTFGDHFYVGLLFLTMKSSISSF